MAWRRSARATGSPRSVSGCELATPKGRLDGASNLGGDRSLPEPDASRLANREFELVIDPGQRRLMTKTTGSGLADLIPTMLRNTGSSAVRRPHF